MANNYNLRDAPAYMCFFDSNGGDMEVWPCPSLEFAERVAAYRQNQLDINGNEECGHFRAFTKLPPVQVYKLHQPMDPARFDSTGAYIGVSDADSRQSAPIHNDQPSIWSLVIEDMKARERFGLVKYKTVLQINDGRDHLVDAYQEALDLVVYLKQEIEQRKWEREN